MQLAAFHSFDQEKHEWTLTFDCPTPRYFELSNEPAVFRAEFETVIIKEKKLLLPMT